MATYLTLYRYTDEGIKKIKDAPDIAKEWEREAKELGITVKALYWLQGEYDAMSIVESPNEEAVMALIYSRGAKGYMRTVTSRAFGVEEVQRSLEKMAVGAARR